MNADYFRSLFDYSYWANHKLLACVAVLTDEQYHHRFDYAMESVHGTLAHMMAAEDLWLARLQGVSPRSLPPESAFTRQHLPATWASVEAKWRAYLANLSDAAVGQKVVYHRTNGEPRERYLWEILGHVANHGTDHRAQTLFMLKQLGAPTFEQDALIYFQEKNS
ncbi:MAG: hypothetical protein OHK0023_25690 [Anaerolineae bacterium]